MLIKLDFSIITLSLLLLSTFDVDSVQLKTYDLFIFVSTKRFSFLDSAPCLFVLLSVLPFVKLVAAKILSMDLS